MASSLPLQHKPLVHKSSLSIVADVGESDQVGSLGHACSISRRETIVRTSLACTYRWATKCLETKVSIVFRESVLTQLAASMMACLLLTAGERRCTRPIADVLKIRVSTSKTEPRPGLGLGLELELELELEPVLWVQ